MTSCHMFICYFSIYFYVDERDPVVAYWCRLYGLQTGLKLSTKQPDETALFIGMIFRRDFSSQTRPLTKISMMIYRCYGLA